jgi:hypothetical protein
MAIVKRRVTPLLIDFPKYKILDEIEKKTKQEANFFTTLESDPDPIQMRRNIKRWKQTMSYYLSHPEKFNFGLKDLK